MMDQLFPLMDDEMETVSLEAASTATPLLRESSSQESPENGAMTRRKESSRSFRSPSGRPELLIEPPSYADVVFAPYAARQPEESGRAVEKNYLRISVSDPQKTQDHGSSGGTFVAYLFTTYTDLPEFLGTSFSVRRRFREVVALADQLGEIYKGYFIPPRPDKNVQLVQTQDFVSNRVHELERYFHRLAAHPVLRNSVELRQFLSSPGRNPMQVSSDVSSVMFDGDESGATGNGNSHAVAEPGKGGRDLLRTFRELRQYVANDWGGSKPLVVEEDKKFVEHKEKIQEFERELVLASEQAELLTKAQENMGTVMGDLGMSLSRLGRFECEDAAIVVGNAAVKASRCYTESSTQCIKYLLTFHEYLALMQAIHGAFAERSKALLTVQTLKSDIASMQARYEKLTAASLRVFGGDKRKIEETKAAIASSEEACASARKEYDRIKERNWEEIERYEVNRQTDLFEMLKGFVQTQVGYAEKLGKAWSEVSESLSSGEGMASSM
ncbi:sorting nexin 2B isoform X2 [Selaginella moellendorffii]|nr:sorting nexin 2B isoform X2 [Selaginella moellendorffii]|eukprot:XP_002962419.2 sorting nexin 2B isoform X2 [Selaginella moellendorffii]